jgi:hypothetical protein
MEVTMARRFISTLLLLLMLTPSMVCVMVFCPEMAQAAVAKPMPCHDSGQNADRAPMLAGDCLQNDLGQGSVTNIPLPLLALIFAGFLLPLTIIGAARHVLPPQPADRPPKRRPSFHRILITQRILQ